MIQTKAYHLTKKTYLNILFNTLKKNVIHLISFIVIWSILLSFYAGFFILGFFAIVPIIVSICLFLWFLFKNIKSFFTETHLQFDAYYMYLTKNNTVSKWSFARIYKVISEENHWLVYLSKREYIYVPKNIFYAAKEQQIFKTYINA